MNKTGEIQEPVAKKGPKQGAQISDEQSQQAPDQAAVLNRNQSNSSETVVEAENPAQFEKLSRWFDILKQVCQEKPRVVLKALQNPDKLMRKQEYDDGAAELAEAQELKQDVRWNIKGLEQAKKDFEKRGFDSQKALAVINYLRNNVSDKRRFKNKDGDYVVVREKYRYLPVRDFQSITELISESDNPVAFLEELGSVIDYQNGGWAVLEKIVNYHKLVKNNPRTQEIINKVKDINNLDKLNLVHSFISESETGEARILFGSEHNKEENKFVADPIQSLSDLDEAHFQELFSEEKLAKVQELWVKIAGEEKIKPELLPHLLKLANNPKLELAFFTFFDDFQLKAYEWKKNELIEDPYKFDWIIKRMELICQEIPEVIDLLQEGFDVDWVFKRKGSFGYNDTYEKMVDIKGLEEDQDLLNAFNNQQLRENAKILNKYGFKMSLTPRHHQLHHDSVFDYINFVRSSDPARLEKSLLLFDLAGEFFEESARETDQREISNVYEIWKKIDNHLDNISVEQVSEAFQFLAANKEELAGFTIKISEILTDLDSSEALMRRIEQILDPEVRQLIQDPFFLEMVGNYNVWENFFKFPDIYLALNKQKDLVIERLEELKRESLSFEVSAETYFRILQLSEDDFESLKTKLKTDSLLNNFKINESLLSSFNALKNVSQKDQELFLRQLRELGIDVSLFDYQKIDSKNLELYFGLNEDQRQEVFNLIKKLEGEYNATIFEKYSYSKLDFQFVCQLIANEDYQEIFYKYLALIETSLLEDGQCKKGRGISFLKWLIEFHVDEDDFDIQEYIGSDGVVTDKFLTEVREKFTNPVHDSMLISLITNQALEKMDEKDSQFWRFWKEYSSDNMLRSFLIKKKDNFSNYVVNNKPTDILLSEFIDDQGSWGNVVEDLLSSDPEILENMDEKDKKFWSFWQDKENYIQKTLIKNRENFDQLVVDGQATHFLASILAREKTNEFLIDDEFSNLANFSSTERQEIRANILRGAAEMNIQNTFFIDIYRHLSEDLSENGQVSEAIKEPFQQAFACELSTEFIQRLDRFYQESQNKKYAALIPDLQSYWTDNGHFMSKIEAVGWKVDDFDKFRSLIQNPEIHSILKNANKDLLIRLTKEIGLSPNNIYYVNNASLNWLNDNLNSPERIAFFKKILNEKPSSFNSCVSAFSLIDGEEIGQVITNPLYTEKLFDAMKEFGNVTSSLITAYVFSPNENSRSEYREKIIKFRKDVHRNIDLMPLTEGAGGVDFLADMIVLTFPGTNFKGVKNELGRLQDRCDHIANLKISEQGYQGQIVSKEKIVQLKDENEPIDEGVISLIKKIFTDQQEQSSTDLDGDADLALLVWAQLLKEAGSTSQKDLFSRDNLPKVIACSRVSLGDKISSEAETMIGDTSQINAKNDILADSKELFGVGYKDNAKAIDLFLQKHQEDAKGLLKALNKKKLDNLEKNIAGNKKMSEENRVDFKEIIEGLRNRKKPETDAEKELSEVERKLLARLLAFMTERSIFAGDNGLRKQVSEEIEKIVLRDKEGQEIDSNSIISGYLTKNVASYFAKETANICTAGNKELFNRPDHFHLNLVNEEGIVVGNIQGYQITYNGQPALIFRGFNPSKSIISTTNAEVLCDQMLDMIKQIAADNNIDQILVTGQEGDFHALTNRTDSGIEKYFANKFFNPANEVDFPFNIAGNRVVNTFYRIT
jgi:hypothetical protein